MLSSLGAAWRNLLKRLTVNWLILGSGVVTILLAMVLLAAGPIYAGAVTQSALTRTLAEAPLRESTIEVQIRNPPGEGATLDSIVGEQFDEALAGVTVRIDRVIDSDTLQLASQGEGDTTELVRLRQVDAIQDKSELVAGTWPTDGSGTAATAVSETTARLLGVGPGDIIELVDPRTSTEFELEVAGIFRPLDPSDRYWFEDELVLEGEVENGGFRTYGPLVVDAGTLASSTTRTTTYWRAHLEFDTLSVAEGPQMRAGVARLEDRLNQQLGALDAPPGRFSDFSVATALDRLLVGTERSLTVTRSSVLALLIQLAVLAGYALALAAGLLVESRRTETALMSSRGASPFQLTAMAAAEGALVSVPAALIAPSLAAWSLEVLARSGPLAPIGLDVSPQITPESRLIVMLAAMASVLALSWPAWRSARNADDGLRRRQRVRSGTQRAGVDIALLGLAVLAYWQLQTIGPEVGSNIQGRFGIDPILIAAPTLGLFAGSVLALRIVPLLARIAERVAVAGSSAVPALSAWQMARRPLRYARASLLLIMAVGIGYFSTAYSSTWLGSQRDQAHFQVGADVRVKPGGQSDGATLRDLQLVGAYESVEGAARAMAMSTVTAVLPGVEAPAQVVLLDSSRAAEVVNIRHDLGPDFAGLMETLAGARPDLPGIPVPEPVDELGLVVEATETTVDLEDEEDELYADLAVVIQDANGHLHRIPLGVITMGAGRQTLAAALPRATETLFRPATPLEIVAIEVGSRYPPISSRSATIDLVGLVAVSDSDSVTVDMKDAASSWVTDLVTVGQVLEAPTVSIPSNQPADALRVEINTGLGFGGDVSFSLSPGAGLPDTFPVVVTTDWVEGTGRGAGAQLDIPALDTGSSRPVVAGVVAAFPGMPGDGPVVVADLATVQVLGMETGREVVPFDEIWLSVDGDDETVARTLRTATFGAQGVQASSDRFLTLSNDPVALGTIGALTLGFIAAGVFAVVGFAVSAAVSARERMVEFGLLRAIGLTSGQLGQWLMLEQAILVATSLALGTLLGWALSAAILPLISVTQQGVRAVPQATVSYPWTTALAIEAGLLLAVVAIASVTALALRRRGLGNLLRVGGD